MQILLVLAFGSGAAALVYELVWFQILELVIGSSAVSLGILLATFMGGTCLGSFLAPHLAVLRSRSPMKVYAAIETGIAVSGILVLFIAPLAGRVYTAWAGFGFMGFLLRGMVAAVCLIPATVLMGATLPILARRVESSARGVSWLGLVYGANIAGAVAGCLVCGFYLLRVHDVTIATLTAAAVNVAVAAGALIFAALPARGEASAESPTDQVMAANAVAPESSWTVYAVAAFSGFCAMAAETVWTRTLGLLFGASVYTLSIILAVFLSGLGIGSAIGSLLARVAVRPAAALGWCQLLAALGIAWAAYSVGVSLPYWPVNPAIGTGIWFNFQLDLDRAFWAVLPATLCWGASFPLALAAAAPRVAQTGALMSRIYAANTVGGIAGALSSSLILVAWVGSHHVEQLLIGIAALAGLLLLPRPLSPASSKAVAAAAIAAIAGLLMATVRPPANELVAHGRYASTWIGKGHVVYAREGLNSSVAVSEFDNGVRTFHVAGKIQASNVPRDMRLQRMLGHLTSLTAKTPRSVLVIGCGAGITAGAVSIDPAVERVTIAEIEPLVPGAASEYFRHENFDVIHSPKVQIHIDDGRHFLLTTRERFDAITADPLDPWVKGAASLYTREFFELVRDRLNPGGTVTMYIQLFETNLDAVKSATATFFDVFPNGTVWGNTYEGKGHDMILLGQAESLRVDLDEMDRRLALPEYMRVSQSLGDIGMNSALDLFATYAGRASDLTAWLSEAAINRDRNLRMQYLAGTALNLDESAPIYADMLAYRRFPSDIFAGTASRLESLRSAMVQSQQ